MTTVIAQANTSTSRQCYTQEAAITTGLQPAPKAAGSYLDTFVGPATGVPAGAVAHVRKQGMHAGPGLANAPGGQPFSLDCRAVSLSESPESLTAELNARLPAARVYKAGVMKLTETGGRISGVFL